tara:strand:+ start:586 stop:1428 length:843 start_codon:yes stop_codon:yes gene_type:complete
MRQNINFSKLHGLGNDFILIDGINQRIDCDLLKAEASLLCDRNFGIGADGVIIAMTSTICDIKMKIFNSDGSSPEMCGNGLRCFSQFVYEQKLIEKDMFSVETDAGKMIPALILKNNKVIAVEVDMGEPQTDTKIMPEATKVHYIDVVMEKTKFPIYIVSMGNPHAVIFVEDFKEVPIDTLGPFLQKHDYFPQGVNLEVVVVKDKACIELIVWERGVGKTLACGTGACAAVVAGVYSNRIDNKVTAQLPGGNLLIEYASSDHKVIMTGPTKNVFSGNVVL